MNKLSGEKLMKKQLLMLSLGVCLLGGAFAQPTVNELKFGPRQEVSSGRTLDDIIAVVGNDVITRRELNNFRPQDRKAGLENLIMRQLLLQAAKQYNINVADTSINVAAKGKGGRLSRQDLRDKLIIGKLQQQVAASYVQISEVEIADMVEKQLQQSGSNIGSMTIPEAKVAHILIRDQGNPQAEQTISQLYQQLQQGADFAALATQFSQDPGSATGGGDLGWVRQGQMVPAFEQTMLSTPTGSMSMPFKSRFGYHILKVEQRRQAPVNNRKLLEAKAKQAIFQRRAAEEWDMWLARLREESHIEIRDKNLQ